MGFDPNSIELATWSVQHTHRLLRIAFRGFVETPTFSAPFIPLLSHVSALNPYNLDKGQILATVH